MLAPGAQERASRRVSPDRSFAAVLYGSYGSRRARATGWPLALAGTAPGMEGERAVGRERLVLRDRRRCTPDAVRPAGRAGRDRGARGRARDGDRAHRAVARTRRAGLGRAARRTRIHTAAR